jgi:tRNA threonylcarbamoyl adenosine modification protein YeaZ
MFLLAIDTSLGMCSVALFKDKQLIAFKEYKELHQQAELLILMIEEVLKESSCWYDQIESIAVSVGPGSFTGIRIGVAAANAIAILGNKKIYPVNVLEAVASQYENNICVVVDAGRNQVYTQKFLSGVAKDDIKLMEYEVVEEYAKGHLIVGNKFAKDELSYSAKQVGEVALKNINLNLPYLTRALPLYIREPDAKKTS